IFGHTINNKVEMPLGEQMMNEWYIRKFYLLFIDPRLLALFIRHLQFWFPRCESRYQQMRCNTISMRRAVKGIRGINFRFFRSTLTQKTLPNSIKFPPRIPIVFQNNLSFLLLRSAGMRREYTTGSSLLPKTYILRIFWTGITAGLGYIYYKLY